jgi:hypothetical protein
VVPLLERFAPSVQVSTKPGQLHPLDQPGHTQPVRRQGRYQRGVLAMIARHRSGRPLVVRCPAVQACQRGVCAAFVDKDDLLGIELGDRLAPGSACRLVALARCQGLFLCVQPRRRRARHIVASLSCCPWCSAHHAQCSSAVASGAPSNRARRIASCSRLTARGRPGIGRRASEPVSRCCTTARFTVVTATSKRRAASRMGRPFATARTKRYFRSVE